MLILVLIIGLVLGLALAGGGSRSSRCHQLPFSKWPDVPPPPGYCSRRPDPQGDKKEPRDD